MKLRAVGKDGFHLYCFVPPGHEPDPGLRGVGGEEVRAVEVEDVGAWVSPSSGRDAPSIDDIRAHDAVIRAAETATVTPLPARFGQWVEGPAELRQRVSGAVPPFGEVLADLAGAVEMGLRIRILGEETGANGGATGGVGGRVAEAGDGKTLGRGRAHMERLVRGRRAARELEAVADELAKTLRERLREVVRADHVPAPDVSRNTALICHLVDRAGADAYRREIEDFAGEAPGLELTVTGPWPPYSFAP